MKIKQLSMTIAAMCVAAGACAADPKLAVVVVTRGSGERGRVAAGIAGKIYRSLDARFGNTGGVQMARTPASLTPRPKLDPRAAAAISDEVENESEAADQNWGAGSDEATGAAGTTNDGTRSNVKSVIMTVPSRPTEVTTRPSATVTTPSTQSAPQSHSEQRPRRVLTNKP